MGTAAQDQAFSAVDDSVGQPGWFGAPARPLLGWYFAPKGGHRGCGVVLCPPFGHEALVSYRCYRHLARLLCEAGFAVLCFDYDGTGDAAGSGDEAERVPAWQGSIVAAMNHLRACSGVTAVALFGVRLGALLAASVASTESCAALVMLAPVSSGRAYCRELMAWRSMKALPACSDPERCVGDDEVVGYPLSAETKEALGRIDLVKLAGLTCPRALIVARDDLPGGEQRLQTSWSALGVDATLSNTLGYAAMMREDAYDACSPAAIWQEVCDWLSQAFALVDTPLAAAVVPSRSVRMQEGAVIIREEVIGFGSSLIGVLTEPASVPTCQRPAVILTNVGANPGVGNHRLYVTLARDLAAKGFTVLRFDRAGMGDSSVAAGGKEHDVYAPVGIANVGEAMDAVSQARGIHRFVLGGLCSGAYFSFHAAVTDPRVVGLLMINILTFQWRDGDSLEVRQRQSVKATGFYLRSSLKPSTWRRTLTGEVNLSLIALKLTGRFLRLSWAFACSWVAQILRLPPPLSLVARQLRAMTARGAEVMMVFGADDAGIDLLHQHLGRDGYLLGNSSYFRLAVIDGVDHTFTPRWSQVYLRDIVSAHLVDRYP